MSKSPLKRMFKRLFRFLLLREYLRDYILRDFLRDCLRDDPGGSRRPQKAPEGRQKVPGGPRRRICLRNFLRLPKILFKILAGETSRRLD